MDGSNAKVSEITGLNEFQSNEQIDSIGMTDETSLFCLINAYSNETNAPVSSKLLKC